MVRGRLLRWLQALALSFCFAASVMQGQGAKQSVPQNPIQDSDADHVNERNQWFFRGRLMHGKSAAELRRRAFQTKVKMRARRAALAATVLSTGQESQSNSPSPNAWTPLGPMPLASDATGNGTQDYHQVAGRATAVAIDPADVTGNTLYIGGAQSGVWKSTNAADNTAGNVIWTALTDDQATLSIGAIAVQPGNTGVILAATGEANNSGDSYFGLGMLRSTDFGATWSLVRTANSGALSFSGLGGTRMAFSTASGQPNTVVAAMATTSEGLVDGAVTASTTRGLYTSIDSGQTWTYDALTDPGGATDATSATSVVYNANAGKFFAAVRYHGFYSSADGTHWTRLAVQPGGNVLSTSACPPQSTANNYGCPIYRAEITALPTRNEMYVWYIYLDSNGNPVDGGIWQSLNGGTSWTPISDTGITNCGDAYGCGVAQGSYNLELLAVPNQAATDLYAGAINLYKCGIRTQNPSCSATPFMNLTHVYGCDPIGAPAHVHPDQHALTYMIPSSGTDSGNALLYFANDGGIYRALDGFLGLHGGSCSDVNEFEDLNQNLGSMTQFVSFSQHPTDPNTLLGGTQDNGSPATGTATTSLSWGNVLGGDGGYNAIDPDVPSNWYASNPDIPPGGLGIQLCTSGVSCNNSGFSFVVTSGMIGDDDGAFYFPYMLDPNSSTAMLVGSCRVWRGARTGGGFTALSPNFETLGAGTCTGSEINQVRALAAGGPTDGNGSKVVYATTSGLGPLNGPLNTPTGGRVWVTTNATAGLSAFADVTNNGPQGNINPNQFPVSGVALDSADATGLTAYVTVMGFTGGPGHVWKTTNAGASWTDFTANLPDAPVNAVVVFFGLSTVYVATDVGVFSSPTTGANWTEVGPSPGANQSGFLPNAAVTALGIFASGGQQLLRASTYGRGVWQFNLSAAPDFQISITNSPRTISTGASATFTGLAGALNGYSGTVTLSCTAGVTPAPSSCSSPQSPLTPGVNTPFTVAAGGAVGDYYFNVQGVGSDTGHTTHVAAAELHIVSAIPDFALTESGSFPTVNAGSSTASGPINVTASNGFSGTISLSCALVSGSGSCSVSPASVSSIPTTATVRVNATSLSAGSYQMVVQGTSGASTHTLLIPFNVGDFQVTVPPSLLLDPGSHGNANFTVAASTYYSGNISSTCTASVTGASCTVTPNPTAVSAGSTVALVATVGVPSNAVAGMYSVNVNVGDASGIPAHGTSFPLTVQDFGISASTASQTVNAGGTTAAYNLTLQASGSSFNSAVTLSCSGVPAGAQCNFQPSAVITPGTASAVTMTIATSATTSAGAFTVTVTGTSAPLLHSASVALIVTAPVTGGGDFQLAVSQAFPGGIAAGGQTQAKVSVTSTYAGSVTASCDASAISGQCIVSPANPVAMQTNAPATLTLTLNVPNTIAPATYNIGLTVADTSGHPSHGMQLPVTVIPDFSVTSGTPSQTLGAGQTTSGPYQLSVAPNPPGSSFAGAVTLSCLHGLPAGAQCIFAPATPLTLGASSAAVVMTISTTASAVNQPSRNRYIYYALFLVLPGIAIGWTTARPCSEKRRQHVLAFVGLLLMVSLLSCGGVSNGGGSGTGIQPTTYQITVTGASAGTPADSAQSAVVTLVVN
ncbi:MAG TPA: sialidase family protein [Candidatus Sulfotelmatobacter sp.]|nr:sialidase family protein [Candidatus Sulfotelmatobacter sp.]